MSIPPVLIIGGGIIGLTLAQALRARSIPFEIYERDAHAAARGPGWGLTIHWALAIFKHLVPGSVLKRLPDAMVDPDAVARGEKGSFVFYDARSGEALFTIPPSERLRLRRESLRSILMPDIDIHWSKSFSHVSKSEDSGVVAHFNDGSTSVAGSIVVGCDGAHSRVRQLLTGDAAKCYQLPIRCLGATVIFSTTVAKAMRDLDPYFMQMGDRTQDVFVYFAFLDGPTNNTRDDKETRTCQIFMSWPLRPEKGLGEAPETAAERVSLMKSLSSEWAEPFRGIIQAMPADTQPVTLRLEDWLPQDWNTGDGSATLAGDAFHAMTMYRGEAYNHGLKDLMGCVEKIEKIYKSGDEWHLQRQERIHEYEAEVRARTHVAVLASRRACLDAHDQAARLTDKSPLVAMRTMNVAELGFE